MALCPEEKTMIMKMVSAKNLAHTLQKVQSLDIKDKDLICDELYNDQPNLLASVLVQQQLGNLLQDVDVLLNILIVLHLALKEAGMKISKVTEQEQEHQLRLLKDTILFSEGLSDDLVKSSVNQYISNHKEPILLTYVIDTMQAAGFFEKKHENSKFLSLAGLNLVACIANAKEKQA